MQLRLATHRKCAYASSLSKLALTCVSVGPGLNNIKRDHAKQTIKGSRESQKFRGCKHTKSRMKLNLIDKSVVRHIEGIRDPIGV